MLSPYIPKNRDGVYFDVEAVSYMFMQCALEAHDPANAIDVRDEMARRRDSLGAVLQVHGYFARHLGGDRYIVVYTGAIEAGPRSVHNHTVE